MSRNSLGQCRQALRDFLGSEKLMRLYLKLMLVVSVVCVAGQSPASDHAPQFSDCWNKFPPSPKFQKQIEEYLQTTDPHKLKLMCAPLYHLNEDACRQFSVVGPGQWPNDVVQWCKTRYGVELKSI